MTAPILFSGNGWTLNRESNLPIVVYGISAKQADELRSLLEHDDIRTVSPGIEAIIRIDGFRWEHLEEVIGEHAAGYEKRFEKLKRRYMKDYGVPEDEIDEDCLKEEAAFSR